MNEKMILSGIGYSKQMSLESGFEKWERVKIAEVRRDRVPEFGSRATSGGTLRE